MNNKPHNLSKTKLYYIWCAIKKRCYKQNDVSYKNYGGRGIKMCNEWLNDFLSFYNWSIENGYKNNCEGNRNTITLDRIDVDKDYSPDNCRWVSMYEQNINKRNTLYVNYNGKKMPLKKVSDILGITYMTLFSRIKKLGWSGDEIFDIAPNSIRHITNKSKEKFIQFARGQYIVVIKRKYIKSFSSLEDAIKCRDEKLEEMGLYVENNILRAKELKKDE